MLALTSGALVAGERNVRADIIGNTDNFNDDFNGGIESHVSSGWWGFASLPVSQRYGCTTYVKESPTGVAHGCPAGYLYWHHGIDISVTSGTLASQVSGTVEESESGVLGIFT